MSDFEPILTAGFQTPDYHRLAVYEAHGGYQTAQRVLRKKTPQEVVEEVRRSGLRGRGGAGFPTGVKWSFLPEPDEGPVYLCVNADESEPGTFCNRTLMENDPHLVLEGILISGFATRATHAVVYLRWEYPTCFRRLREAIDEAYEAGYFGENLFGTDYSLDVTLHRGAGAYICGEETGLIESLEGKRAWPRIKPPYPAVKGLFARPTVVNNVETLACVKPILERSADWFRSIGVPPDPAVSKDPGSFGPKMFGISGHVNRPGCYEAPLGISCRELIDRFGHGVRQGRKIKAVVPGGISTGLLCEDELDTPMDFRSLQLAGCLGLGTACPVVFDETYRIVDFLYQACRFFTHESCGQCTPCREGTRWALELAGRIRDGRGRPNDLVLLEEIGQTIGIEPGTTICGLADGAAWAIRTTIEKFREELERWISSPTKKQVG